MQNLNFKIIGGGIAGLSTALGLAKLGHNASIFERAPSFEPFGAGLQLGPNAARALQHVGAWDAVAPIAYAPPEIHIRDGLRGTLLKRLVLGKSFETQYGFPYRVAHRADLHEALLSVVAASPTITIKLGVETDHGSEGFEGVIAADGIRSKTRESLFPDSKAIVTSNALFRALVRIPEGPTAIALDCVNLWMFPAGHVVHYPVGGSMKLNVVAITPGNSPLIHFNGACNALIDILARSKNWTDWPGAFVPALPRWNKANVTLIGDAAHGTLPFLAQGAAMALEDAACLSALVEKHGQVTDSFAALSKIRISRVSRLHRETLIAGDRYHMQGAMRIARNMALKLMTDKQMMSNLDWIYTWQNITGE